MRHKRASGILLHPTSLPGRFGIGDIGPAAWAFVDFLTETGQHWWQMLPLGPTGAGNSPYQSHSSFAGNPLLISPEEMVNDGFLDQQELPDVPPIDNPDHRVDFHAVAVLKESLLRRAFSKFHPDRDHKYQEFVTNEAEWLDDFSLYMALKHAHNGQAWWDWEPALRMRQAEALAVARRKFEDEVRYHKFVQYLFARQWHALRTLCRSRNIELIGDLPIYVAEDSADVWSRPDLFHLDENGRATLVAGVPPDLFSPEHGQRWGNPIYNWDAHKAEGYKWWASRLKASINHVDLVRLDHFRGFEAYWEVPATSPTAAIGQWVEGPGADFLESMRNQLGSLPLVAEDLGVITDKVEKLRDDFGLPGMRILQFGFGPGGDGGHLPHNHVHHCVVYTGTHDNDTSVGWFYQSPPSMIQSQEQIHEERAYTRRYIGSHDEAIHWAFNRLAMKSVADTAILPLQDILGLGSSARMNIPGEADGHWGWRFEFSQITHEVRAHLADLTYVYQRWNGQIPNHLHRW